MPIFQVLSMFVLSTPESNVACGEKGTEAECSELFLLRCSIAAAIEERASLSDGANQKARPVETTCVRNDAIQL